MDLYSRAEPLPRDMPLSTINIPDIIRKVSTRKYVEIPYSLDKLTDALKELTRETTTEFMRLNAGINRVFDNIRNGECGVCLSNFDSEETSYCLRCCGALFCEACLADANQLKSQYDVISKTNQPTGSCANCKARIYMNDVIGVPAKFNIEDIVKMLTQETIAAETEPEIEVQNPKLQALLDIIRGKTPENMEKFTKNIRNLMQGKNDVPYTGTDRKVLVFASFNETLEIIENLLKQANIKFESLHGTHNEISQTIKRFQESGTVLLVNSRTHCAGLNIQFATDIVYAHKITDANIEAQVAGRGQRIGRKFNLNIWYLLFANEQEMLDRQYTEH
jgi:SNF2 family DNA or RNA helicase